MKASLEVAIKYLVALPIPEPTLGFLADIKESLRPAGWRDTMDPHITVLAPDAPRLPEDEAIDAFMRAASDLNGFSLRASQLRHFARRDHRAIYLRPLPVKPMIDLFDAILDRATWQETDSSTKRPYHPHITLVTQLPTQEAIEAEEQLQSLKLDLQFGCTKVCLYAKQKTWDRWKVLVESPLPIAK